MSLHGVLRPDGALTDVRHYGIHERAPAGAELVPLDRHPDGPGPWGYDPAERLPVQRQAPLTVDEARTILLATLLGEAKFPEGPDRDALRVVVEAAARIRSRRAAPWA